MDELKQTTDQPELPAEVAKPRYAIEMDQRMDADLKRISQFFLKHPSLALTFGYLMASVMGMVFIVSLLAEFNFNALSYLELTDFLLAAITHPQVFVILLLGISGLVLTLVAERKLRQHFPGYESWVDKYYKSQMWLPNWLILCSALFLYVFYAGQAKAPLLAEQLKKHSTEQYQLSLIYPIQPGGKEIRQLNEVQIITRTVSYLWIYHQDQVKLIPHANVAALIPVLDKGSGKKLDKKPEGKADKPAVAQETVVKEPAAVPVKN